MSIVILTPQQKYYQKNKDIMNRKRLIYYHNKERLTKTAKYKEYRKDYYQKNRDRCLEYQKQYYKLNSNVIKKIIFIKKGRVKDYNTDYYQKNKEKLKLNAKENYEKRKLKLKK